jgi:ApaG protein
MNTKISEGISISVETFYQSDYSAPMNNEFMFAYKITISNGNDFPVKLLSRKWNITDSNGTNKIVEGEGVIGQQPVIAPKSSFQYISGCNLTTELGRMEGCYVLENQFNKNKFIALVPSFLLEAPSKMN